MELSLTCVPVGLTLHNVPHKELECIASFVLEVFTPFVVLGRLISANKRACYVGLVHVSYMRTHCHLFSSSDHESSNDFNLPLLCLAALFGFLSVS